MSESDESSYDLIRETNALANALLADTIAHSLEFNKKALFENCKQILVKFKLCLLDYVNKIKVLKTLARISVIHKLNSTHIHNEDFEDLTEVINESVQKMLEIFETHLKHDSSKIISKSEYDYILSQQDTILNLSKIIDNSTKNIDEISEMESHRKEISSLKRLLEKVFHDLSSSQTQIDTLQSSILSDASKMIHSSQIQTEQL